MDQKVRAAGLSRGKISNLTKVCSQNFETVPSAQALAHAEIIAQP
jgi:hypothetical protein